MNRFNSFIRPMPAEVGSRRDFGIGVTVPIDGPDDWFRPVAPKHFSVLGMNVPNFLFLFQEASGDLFPTIGSPAAALVAEGTGQSYLRGVAGWASKSVGLDGASIAQNWLSASTEYDVVAGESYAVILYAAIAAPAVATRFLIVQGSGNDVRQNPDGTISTMHDGVNSSSSVNNYSDINTIHQFGWYRRGDTNVSGTITDLESLVGTHGELAYNGFERGIGTMSAFAPPAARYNWMAIWKGTNAEFSMASYLSILRN